MAKKRPRIENKGVLPDSIVKMKLYSRADLIKTWNKLIKMPLKVLEEHVKDEDTIVLEALMGTILAKAVNEGCHLRLEHILNRIHGRVPVLKDDMGDKPDPLVIEFENGKQIIIGSEEDRKEGEGEDNEKE